MLSLITEPRQYSLNPFTRLENTSLIMDAGNLNFHYISSQQTHARVRAQECPSVPREQLKVEVVRLEVFIYSCDSNKPADEGAGSAPEVAAKTAI